MAISFRIINPINNRAAQINVTLEANLLVDPSNYNSDLDYYFKFQTSGNNTADQRIGPQVVQALDELAVKGSGGVSKSIDEGNSTPYASIKEMVEDYVFDIMNGHSANHGSTGSTERLPIDLGQN